MPDSSESQASDIPKGGWVDRLAPPAARPFLRLARLDRPIGCWLLLFPCWWAVALASPDLLTASSLRLLALFGIGALAMRGAGCAFNDICDRHFDAQVARTRDRPLPSGQITVRQAAAFMLLLLLVGLAVLLAFNRFAIAVGVASLALVFAYPLMKRVTFWPQLFLGLAFNWGALLGWAAVRGDLAPAAALLYAGRILWTLGYDTIYAHQDRIDDAAAGVKSSARALGSGSKPWLYAFYAGAAALLALAGREAGLGWPFFALLAIAGLQLGRQVARVDLGDPKNCLRRFKSNRLFGWLVLGAIAAGQLANHPP